MHGANLHKPLAFPLREAILKRRYKPFVPIRNSFESPVPLGLLVNGKRLELNKHKRIIQTIFMFPEENVPVLDFKV